MELTHMTTSPSTADFPPAACIPTLHEHGCFVIPNPWDRGRPATLRQLGFQALATTSAGFAFSSRACLIRPAHVRWTPSPATSRTS